MQRASQQICTREAQEIESKRHDQATGPQHLSKPTTTLSTLSCHDACRQGQGKRAVHEAHVIQKHAAHKGAGLASRNFCGMVGFEKGVISTACYFGKLVLEAKFVFNKIQHCPSRYRSHELAKNSTQRTKAPTGTLIAQREQRFAAEGQQHSGLGVEGGGLCRAHAEGLPVKQSNILCTRG